MREPHFEPVPGLWRFHLIYFFITMALGWSFFPYSLFASLFLIAAACVFGLLLAYFRKLLATHILALAIGLSAPVVVLARLLLHHTFILLSILILGIVLARKTLFKGLE